jgi:hypothetical protein
VLSQILKQFVSFAKFSFGLRGFPFQVTHFPAPLTAGMHGLSLAFRATERKRFSSPLPPFSRNGSPLQRTPASQPC